MVAATPVLLHVPPVVPSDKVVVDPEHKIAAPLIDPGNAFTVTIAVILQPLAI